MIEDGERAQGYRNEFFFSVVIFMANARMHRCRLQACAPYVYTVSSSARLGPGWTPS